MAATYYWVGNANGLTSAKANWHTSAKACDGAGNAAAAPVAADTINFVSNCTSDATIDSALSVTNFTIAAGYTGTITQNANVTLSGNLTKNDGTWAAATGTITFNGTGNQTVTVNGVLSGTVIVSQPAGAYGNNFTVASGTTISLGNNATTTMNTVPNYGGGTFTNNGTILVGTGTWNFSGGFLKGLINNGTITNSGSGWVFSGTGLTNNAGATITYPNGSVLNMGGNFTQLGTFDLTNKTVIFNGGSYQTVTANGALGGTVVVSQLSGSYSNGFTIASGTIVNFGNNATTSMNTAGNYGGGFTNNGTVLLGTGVWNYIGSYRNLTNNGTITSSNSNWIFAGAGLINNVGATITYPGSGSILNFNGDFTQNGTFDFTGKIITFNGGGLDSTITANGVLGGIVVINKSTLNGSSVTVATGTSINLGDDPTITINAGSNYYRKIYNNGTINIGTGTFTISGLNGYLINNGTIISSSTDWVFNGTGLNNSITGTINTSLLSTISLGADFTQLGNFDLTGKTITFSYTGISSQTITSNGVLGGTVVFNITGSGASIVIATGTSIYLGNNPTTVICNSNCGYYGRTITNNGIINVGIGAWSMSSGSLINNIGATIDQVGTSTSISGSFTNVGTFTSSSLTSLSITGDLTNTGTMTTGAVAVTISGNLTQTGAGTSTFATTTFNGSTSSTVNVGGILGGIVIINKTTNNFGFTVATGTSINLGTNVTSVLNGSVLTNNGIIMVSGIWTLSNTSGSATYQSSLINNGTITHTGSSWNFPVASGAFNFINNIGATTTYSGTTMSLHGNFTQNGTFDLIGKTVTFNGSSNATLTTASSTLGGSIILNKTAANTLTLANNLTVQDFTLTSGTLANVAKTLTINGNLTVTPAAQTYFGGASLSVVMASSSDTNITAATGTITVPVTINKTSGKVTLLGNYTGSGAAATVTVNSGALYLNGKTLSATTTINNGGELQIQGNENFTTPTLNTGSTFTYVGNGNGSQDTYYINPNLSYSNLKINSTDINDTFLPFDTSSENTNLISYWKGDSNALDSAGSNNGTF